MNLPGFVASAAVVVTLSVPLVAAAGQQPPPLPKPGPQHEILKMDVGTWDATVETAEPGGKPMTAKGVEVSTMGCGGLCLITDFKGEFIPGVPFQGHGVGTWDALKKKYSASWTDSLSQGLALGESTWDAAAKKMSGSMEGPDMTGTVVKLRSVVDYSTPGKRVFTAYAPGPDGKEVQAIRITYTRRK